jgi:hypothetical protein
MLNYITAELRMREVEDLASAEVGSKNASEESKGNTKVDEEVLKIAETPRQERGSRRKTEVRG